MFRQVLPNLLYINSQTRNLLYGFILFLIREEDLKVVALEIYH